MLYKSWQGELKATTSGDGGFSGYASVFDIRDDGGDIVHRGAFLDGLEDFLHHGFISDGHNWDSVSLGAIGTIVDAKEDERGLWIQTEYHSTPIAQTARQIAKERLDRGKSVGLSIGYGIEPGGADFSDDGTRHLLKLKLYEVSQVNVPMLRQAGLTGIKGFGVPFDDHSEQVRVALAEWLERARSGSEVRLKEGRPISEARRGRMVAVKDSLLVTADEIRTVVGEIEALLKETEPRATDQGDKGAAAQPDPKLAALFAQFQALDALHPDLTIGATRTDALSN